MSTWEQRYDELVLTCAQTAKERDEASDLIKVLRGELAEIMELVRSAQTTISVEDYGDALAGAERRLKAMLGSLESEGEGRAAV